MTYHVAGIDLSLTNSGVAVLRGDDLDGRPFVRNISSDPVKTATKNGKPFASPLDRRNRIQSIAARVVMAALNGLDPENDDAPVFVVEDVLLIGSNGGQSVIDRVWLFGLVIHLLCKHGIVVLVATTTMKKYASGNGATPVGAKSSKSAVLLAMPRMFPQIVVVDDNAADALALAAMGARALDHPREPSVQRVTPSALNSVEWPTNTQRRNPAQTSDA